MSITVVRGQREAKVQSRYWTLADLAALPDELPTGPAVYEIWDGELLLMPPPADFHGSIEARITTVLVVHGEWEGLGRVSSGEVGVVLSPGPPVTCVGADVVFLLAEQLPARHSPEGYLLTLPALVAEVRSKNDRTRKLARKVERYLEAGVRLVWVADEKTQTVTVYRSGAEPVVLTRDDELTAEGILPDLRFPVRRLFDDLR